MLTPAGELTYTLFPGPPPFYGCTQLDGVPIAPVDPHRLLELIGDDHSMMPYIGDGAISVSPRQPM